MPANSHLVGAVLPKGSVASASIDLEEAGLASHEVLGHAEDALTVTPRAERRLGTGLVRGAGVGAALAAAAMVVLAAVTSPPEARTVSIATGAAAGAVAGAFLGGYAGMTRHRHRLRDRPELAQVDTGPHEVLVVVDTDDTVSTASRAEQILTRHGGRLVTPRHPDAPRRFDETDNG